MWMSGRVNKYVSVRVQEEHKLIALSPNQTDNLMDMETNISSSNA